MCLYCIRPISTIKYLFLFQVVTQHPDSVIDIRNLTSGRLVTTPSDNGGPSPRSSSPVSSVDPHCLSPSPVSVLSTATSAPSTQSDMTLESGYCSSSQSGARRGIMPPPPPPLPQPSPIGVCCLFIYFSSFFACTEINIK